METRYAGCHRYLPLWKYASDKLAATDHRSLSMWRYVLDMLAATGICHYGGLCTTIQCGVVSYMFRSIDRR